MLSFTKQEGSWNLFNQKIQTKIICLINPLIISGLKTITFSHDGNIAAIFLEKRMNGYCFLVLSMHDFKQLGKIDINFPIGLTKSPIFSTDDKYLTTVHLYQQEFQLTILDIATGDKKKISLPPVIDLKKIEVGNESLFIYTDYQIDIYSLQTATLNQKIYISQVHRIKQINTDSVLLHNFQKHNLMQHSILNKQKQHYYRGNIFDLIGTFRNMFVVAKGRNCIYLIYKGKLIRKILFQGLEKLIEIYLENDIIIILGESINSLFYFRKFECLKMIISLETLSSIIPLYREFKFCKKMISYCYQESAELYILK